MDRHLKERLVGAAVLVAAAIILIPEMLSGPKESAPVRSEPADSAADASGVKTYTIDLTSPKAPASEQPSTPLQPLVETPPAHPAERPTESAQESATPVESVPKHVVATQAAQESEKPIRAAPVAEKHALEKKAEEKTRASTPVVTASAPSSKIGSDKGATDKRAVDNGSWAVQVASFGARATSERIASELKAKGYAAFVIAFAAKGQTMYRVRVGPVEDRAAAEALLQKIKPLHPGAAIVPQ